MGLIKRVFIVLLINILIVLTLNTIIYATGLDRYLYAYGVGYQGLFIMSFIWGMGGAFISLLISRFIVKLTMGVKVINPATATDEAKEVLNIVYGLAQKAGIKKMPEVGIYESEEINAFATGPTKNRALVAVSSGLLYRMDRNQLEGVLGHEITHIANGDMVTMTLVQGIMNALIIFATEIVIRILDSALRDRDGRGGLSGFTMFFARQIIYSILSLLALPVIAAVSRYREYRADAGGARLAGLPKMVGALKALKGTESLIDTQHAEVASLKISGRHSQFLRLFATHPSLDDRIRRLEMGRY